MDEKPYTESNLILFPTISFVKVATQSNCAYQEIGQGLYWSKVVINTLSYSL